MPLKRFKTGCVDTILLFGVLTLIVHVSIEIWQRYANNKLGRARRHQSKVSMEYIFTSLHVDGISVNAAPLSTKSFLDRTQPLQWLRQKLPSGQHDYMCLSIRDKD